MQLDELLTPQKTIDKLRVLSFEMNIYLVEVYVQEFRGLVRESNGRPQRFSSVAQIKELFSDCDVRYAELVHESPYDEMIGNPPRAANRMTLPIQFQQNKA